MCRYNSLQCYVVDYTHAGSCVFVLSVWTWGWVNASADAQTCVYPCFMRVCANPQPVTEWNYPSALVKAWLTTCNHGQEEKQIIVTSVQTHCLTQVTSCTKNKSAFYSFVTCVVQKGGKHCCNHTCERQMKNSSSGICLQLLHQTLSVTHLAENYRWFLITHSGETRMNNSDIYN